MATGSRKYFSKSKAKYFTLDTESERFIHSLKVMNLKLNSKDLAKRVISCYHILVDLKQYENIFEFYDYLRSLTIRLCDATGPYGYTAESISLHIKKLFKEDIYKIFNKPEFLMDHLSLQSLVERGQANREASQDSDVSSDIIDEQAASFQWDQAIVERFHEILFELNMEIDSIQNNIAVQALDHIHTNETILCYDYSSTVIAFIKNASRSRNFSVICVEGSFDNTGHLMAKELSTLNIPITIIPNSAVHAIMSRVNKVVLGAYAITVNGNALGPCGVNSVALSAKYFGVPLLVCCGTHKLVPRQSIMVSHSGLSNNINPNVAGNIPFYYELSGLVPSNVDIYEPFLEEIYSDMITLFITNIGSQAPHYLWRLGSEMFTNCFNYKTKRLV